jgi:hypothetical protein
MNFRMVWIGSDDDSDGDPVGDGTPAIPDGVSAPGGYEQRGTEMIRKERLENGRVKFTTLTNFSARIVRDVLLENDAVQRRNFGIEAELDGRRIAFVVSAAEFSRMSWVLKQLGPQAIVYPGKQQHARAAIQFLSGPVRRERIFTQLGWRKQEEDWMYLQKGGAVGALGLRRDFQVQLPDALVNYQVEAPTDSGEIVRAVRASLRFLSLAPDRISFPLLAAVYRAPLGEVDFSVFLTGRTGTFKTALAALCQQHFGPAMDASRLPANFSSTANALEGLAFCAKDTLLVVDDFVPIGGVGDGALQGIAERLFRAAGNHQGRSRMGGSGRLSASQPPRALLLATGEEVPRGQSLRGRMLIIEVVQGDLNLAALSECQAAAEQGQLAAAMGAYLTWIASGYEELKGRLKTRVQELLRQQIHRGAAHARLPVTMAELQSGWEMWLQFAVESSAIYRAEQADLQRRSEEALSELVALQTQYHQASDPALRFMALLRAALASGRAHVADRRGMVPERAEVWGWRRKQSGQRWVPQGICIGWVVGNDLFLESTAAYQVAQHGPERLPVSEQTLRHRMHEHGLLASVDAGRQMLLVRRTLAGCARQVLHLRASDLVGSIAETVRNSLS